MSNPPVVLPSSSINRTAKAVGRAPDAMQPMARRVIEHGGGDQALADGNAGKLLISMKDYSVPIEPFDASYVKTPADSKRTGWYMTSLYAAGWSLNQFTQGNMAPGARGPVRYTPGSDPNVTANTNLHPGTGNDRIVLVEDQVRGICWGYWTFHEPDFNALALPNLLAGLGSQHPAICNGGNSMWAPYSPSSSPLGDRGMGTTKRMLVTTGAEVASGVVAHAAELSIAATWYADTVAGAKVGTDWLLPARRVEWDAARYAKRNRDGVALDPDRSKLSLEGLRIAFDVAPADRRAYVYARVADQPMRDFWMIVVNCWCDYGLVVAETAGYGMASEFTGLLGSDLGIYQGYGWSLAQVETQRAAMADFMNDHVDVAYVVVPAP